MIGLLSLLFVAATGTEDLCDHATSTADIVECQDAVYKMADSQMTYDWREALARMKRNDADLSGLGKVEHTFAQALLDSQRKWLAFRDAQCRLEGLRMKGGSGQGYSVTICLIKLTELRATELRDIDF